MIKLQHLLCIPLLFFVTLLSAQTRTIKGRVLSSQDQTPIPGVTVSLKGSQQATTTGADGNFSLSAPAGRITLELSSVSFAPREVAVGENETDVSFELTPTTQQLNEVVVTALGITKNKRNLNYSTQTVETKDLTKARETNIGNSLSGKVAGLDVVRSSQGVGSNVRVVLRGDRSFTGGSEAFIVIDGIPGDLGSLNPDDIASINVLKGSSAAALYGNEAANGAIMVTTKKGVAGKTSIGVNSSLQLDKAVNLHDFQNVYAQGSNGNYLKDAEATWGPRMEGQVVKTWSVDPADSATTYALTPHPDNYDDFFSLGKTFTNGVSLSGGGDKIQAYFSYNNIYGNGIVDNNKFNRHNFNFRVGGNLTDKLSFDAKITYFWQKATNFVRSDEDFSNVNRQIVRLPSNIDIDYARSHVSYVNDNGELKQNYWHPGSNGGENPFWVKYNVTNFFEANAVKGMASLTYKILPTLSVMLRQGLNRTQNNSDEKRFFDTYVIANSGYYSLDYNQVTSSNSDFLIMYNNGFGDFNVSVTGGGNMRQERYSRLNSVASELVNENIFTLNNAAQGKLSADEDIWKRDKQSLYVGADIGYKNWLVLSASGRNDWSSTLPPDNWSYPFGSLGLTAVISDMVTMPSAISFLKLRASIAKTGIDPDPFITKEYFSVNPGGSIAKSNVKPVDTLKPEITTSRELGFDLNLLNNRIGIEFTYYKTNSKNQLVSVATPPASGYSSKFINAGNIQNKGIEVTLNFTPIKSTDFTWTAYVNYAKNDNKVISIIEGSPELVLRNDFINITKIVEGKPYGEMYSRGLLRDSATGTPIIQDDGRPAVTAAKNVYLGNSRPKWNGGFGNRFTYKNFSLSFLVTARMGGRITSFTDANLEGDGLSERTLEGRDGMVLPGIRADKTPNTTSVTAEQYWNILGGRNTPVGEMFTYSASNIRLREMVLSYNIPQGTLDRTPIKGASISLTGRNLFFFKNDAGGFDPELVVSTDKGSIGTESFCLPYTRSFGINLNLNF
jgi:TonB-linked SusC/RagA family outer membrane protein